MASIELTEAIERRNRGDIDHGKVVCVYTEGVAAQEAQVDAYISAWGDIDTAHKYAIALNSTAGRSEDTLWTEWAKELARYCVTHDIEAICCASSLDSSISLTGFGYNDKVSAPRFLGHLRIILQIMDYFNYSEFSEIDAGINWLTDTRIVGGFHLNGAGNLTGSPVNDLVEDGNINHEGVGSGDSLVVNGVAITAFSGVQGTSWDDDETYTRDTMEATEANRYKYTIMPSWRIGYYDAAAAVPACDSSAITAMVARSKAAEGSIASHVTKPIVNSSRHRTGNLTAGQPVVADIMFEELGFTNRKWGWCEGTSLSANEFLPAFSGSIPEATGYARYDRADGESYVDFVVRTAAPGDTSASVYRDTRSEYAGTPTDYHWEALNSTTFPISVWAMYDQAIVNIDVAQYTTQFTTGDAGQVFEVEDGAFAYFSTSEGLRMASGFINNGGCAAYGSYTEPLSSQVTNGNSFFLQLLRGLPMAVAALRASGPKIFHNPELVGDGLYRPFYREAAAISQETSFMKKDFTFIPLTGTTIGVQNSIGNIQLATASAGIGPKPFNVGRAGLISTSTTPGAVQSFRLYRDDGTVMETVPGNATPAVISATRGAGTLAAENEACIDDWITAMDAISEIGDVYAYSKVSGNNSDDWALLIVSKSSYGQHYARTQAVANIYHTTLNAAGNAASDFTGKILDGNVLAGRTYSGETGAYNDEIRDSTGKTIFAPNLINMASADATLFGQSYGGQTRFTLYMVPTLESDGSTDSAQLTVLEGQLPKFASLTLTDLVTGVETVLTREDFKVGEDDGGGFVFYNLSDNSGVENRTLSMPEYHPHTVRVVMTSDDLLLSRGGSSDIIDTGVIV